MFNLAEQTDISKLTSTVFLQVDSWLATDEANMVVSGTIHLKHTELIFYDVWSYEYSKILHNVITYLVKSQLASRNCKIL